ncbi:MAG TPA: flavodoxin domain-containing protein [Streptosporangiaceae bacterium]|nr:flavodoxin domain-containing protein [Streptosporangiaceae bacterium]
MRVLVTYGSSRGGTEGLARMVAGGLRECGLDVEVLPPKRARDISGYDAVVVGGALYAFRWHRAARGFVRKHATALMERPTYFFSSGPLDDSAASNDIPPIPVVTALMARVGARGHMTFGGRLSPAARGMPASAMAKKHAGDWRDAAQVRTWALQIGRELTGATGAPAQASREGVAP